MKFFDKIISLIKKSNEDNITLYAAQSAFFLILSSIPFMIVLLSVIQYFFNVSENILDLLSHSFYRDIYDFLKGPIYEFTKEPHISFLSVGAITTLWSASRGFNAAEQGIKRIYEILNKKHFIINRLISLLYTLLFVVTLICALIALVFGRTIVSFLDSHISIISFDLGLTEYVLSFILLAIFFAIFYASLSSRKIKFKNHLPGAVFSSLGWGIFSWAFSIYINTFANYSRIYGSLTTIILLMLWVYFCMIILLFGAEINMSILKRKEENNK